MTKKRRRNYLIPVAVITGIGLAIYSSSKPWKVYQQEKAKATEMRSDLDTLQKSDARMKERSQLMNPVQKEEEARRLGYVRPDEVPLLEHSTKAPAAPAEQPKKTPKKPEVVAPPIDLKDGYKNDEVQAAPQ